jgi:general secretion pathway protein H
MAKIRMSQAGNDGLDLLRDAGFTLFELLAVLVVLAMMIAAVSALYRPPSAGTQVKATAYLAASRLRDLRAAAMTTGSERVATIDVSKRMIGFSDGREPLQLNKTIAVAVTGADAERRSETVEGIRFYPNGSSSGATITLRSEGEAYEVRINWLTGRVSTGALN